MLGGRFRNVYTQNPRRAAPDVSTQNPRRAAPGREYAESSRPPPVSSTRILEAVQREVISTQKPQRGAAPGPKYPESSARPLTAHTESGALAAEGAFPALGLSRGKWPP